MAKNPAAEPAARRSDGQDGRVPDRRGRAQASRGPNPRSQTQAEVKAAVGYTGRAAQAARSATRARALIAVGVISAMILVAVSAALLASGEGSANTAALTARAITRSRAAYTVLEADTRQLTGMNQACRAFTCHIAIDMRTSRDYKAYGAAIAAIRMPAGPATNAAGQLEEAATQTVLAGRALATAKSPAELKTLEEIIPTMADVIQVQQDSAYLLYVLRSP